MDLIKFNQFRRRHFNKKHKICTFSSWATANLKINSFIKLEKSDIFGKNIFVYVALISDGVKLKARDKK